MVTAAREEPPLPYLSLQVWLQGLQWLLSFAQGTHLETPGRDGAAALGHNREVTTTVTTMGWQTGR